MTTFASALFPVSGLSHNEINSIEVAMTKTLTSVLRQNVIVRIDEQLEIVVFAAENGEPRRIVIDSLNKKLRRHLLHQIEREIEQGRILNEARILKELRGSTIKGEISNIADDGSLFVTLQIADCYRKLILGGTCPVRFQPNHERGRYTIGSEKVFCITSVVPVTSNNSAKVRILLSRTSRELPSLLLQELSQIDGIKCLKRIPGGFSNLVTPLRIPKDIINTVGKALEEHINVSILAKYGN